MTLNELRSAQSDVILDEITDFNNLKIMANGAALFYVSLSGGNKPKDGRTVLWAGHVLTAGMTDRCEELFILRTTASGNPKIDAVPRGALGPNGRVALFRTKPIGALDVRNAEPWTRWK